MTSYLKLKLYKPRHGAVEVRRLPIGDRVADLAALKATIAGVRGDGDVDIFYVDGHDKCRVTSDDELSAARDAMASELTFHVFPARKAEPGHGAPRCGPRRRCGEAPRARCGGGAPSPRGGFPAGGPCGGFAKLAEVAEALSALSDEEKLAKMAEMASRFASKVEADKSLDGPAKWMAAAAAEFAAAHGASGDAAGAAGETAGAARETAGAECAAGAAAGAAGAPPEEPSAAERVAVAESLETATAGAPTPDSAPEGATALGLDQVRIAVQNSLETAAAAAAAPAEESKDGWEDVAPPQDAISALRTLEEMGLTKLVGLEACLAAVQAHTTEGRVDLNAAVADVVALLKA